MSRDPEDQADDTGNTNTNPGGNANGWSRVPVPLRNWQVIEPERSVRPLEDGEARAGAVWARPLDEKSPEKPVMEIDGEATVVNDVDTSYVDTLEHVVSDATAQQGDEPQTRQPHALDAPPSHSPGAAVIRDQGDSVVVMGLEVRRIEVTPGEPALLTVDLLNNGRWAALFEVALEGWIDEQWCDELPVRIHLEPGERQHVTVALTPPRQPTTAAGEHGVAVVARSGRYPGHLARVGATLVVARYSAFKLGTPQPRRLRTSWFQRTATLQLPLINLSNYPATFFLQGLDRRHQVEFSFGGELLDGDGLALLDDSVDGLDAMLTRVARVKLAAGQSVQVPVAVRPQNRPWLALVAPVVPFRLVARLDAQPPLRRAVDSEVACSALIGLWQMALLAVLGLVAFFGTGIAGLALLLALRNSPTQVAPAPAAAAPSAPPVTFVIQVDQPMPTRVSGVRVPGVAPLVDAGGVVQVAPPAVESAVNAPDALAGVPVVQANQVTAPGEPVPANLTPLQPIVVSPPNVQGAENLPSIATGNTGTGNPAANPVVGSGPAAAPGANRGSNVTYAQMFQEVALRYDLNWRMLAAQAYVESGFDSLALSGQGDMGLMQIRPATWNEFAPAVEAADPFDSYSNVLVGAVYLDYLRTLLGERGYSQQEWMLLAYNWGPDQVLTYITEGGSWETLSAERRQYVEEILRIAESIPAN